MSRILVQNLRLGDGFELAGAETIITGIVLLGDKHVMLRFNIPMLSEEKSESYLMVPKGFTVEKTTE